MNDYPDGFSNEWRNYMLTTEEYENMKTLYDKATDPDAGLKLDFNSKKREGMMSGGGYEIRHEMQRMADVINSLVERIDTLEKQLSEK